MTLIALLILMAFAPGALAGRADLVGSPRIAADQDGRLAADPSTAAHSAGTSHRLAKIAGHMPALSESARLRRRIADATFCLPQNIMGILYYAFLTLSGNTLAVTEAAGAKVILTKTPFAASLGKYIFVSEPLLCESTLRHEYGHVMQGYKRGPFYLLFEGATSFVQAAVSLAVPSFAANYLDRWPENEAERLGAAAWPPSQH